MSDADLKAADVEAEHRTSERRAYTKNGEIAAWNGEDPPSELTFHTVRFYNLSQTGVSFIVRRPPLFTQGVVKFTSPSGDVFILVEVRHCTFLDSERNECLVGCQFIRRLKTPLLPGML